MGAVPTVKVVNWKPGGEGYLIINRSDFDTKVHTLYEEGKRPPAPATQRKRAKGKAGPKRTVRKLK